MSLLAALVVLLAGCGGGVKNEVAVVQTDLGKFVLEFYPDAAPNHVANFKKLAREGVYDGVLFHRVIPGFVVQAGDPKTKDPSVPKSEYGSGGTGHTLEAEFNDHKFERGTLGMARGPQPNSADSQWFICLQPAYHLNGQYTAFGDVAEGMDVIDKIAASETDARDNPITPIHIQSIKIMSRKEAGLK